jgi:hypothetical protein
MVLAEFAMAQMRATFRSARWWLIAGAVLTLAGSLLYLSSIKGDDGPTGSTSGTTPLFTLAVPGTLNLGTDDSFDSLPDECRTEDLEVLLSTLVVPAATDAYQVTVVAPPACVGTLNVPKGVETDQLTLDVRRFGISGGSNGE